MTMPVDLVKALKLELLTESMLRQWETPLETLRDMVLWLNWIRQRQARIGCTGERPCIAAGSAKNRDPSTA
jgi:hypothetical protein